LFDCFLFPADHPLVRWNDAAKRHREALEMEIRHCRAKPTHDKKFYKVSFGVVATGSNFERAIVQGMTSLGGRSLARRRRATWSGRPSDS
jgi:hypothetical protein